MKGEAFCPAHVTGFFKAEKGRTCEDAGSQGAGFSISSGVTSRVRVMKSDETGSRVTVSGYEPDETTVSDFVMEEFLKISGERDCFLDVTHEISIPVGYGLGCSGAVALSLSMALNQALGTGLTREETGRIAHKAEIACKTGLGDVLAAYHGGFEIRSRPGAPGVGRVEKINLDAQAVLICFAPISTRRFMNERIDTINGLGGRMVERLAVSKSTAEFQEMSLRFARYADVMTPRMEAVAGDLHENDMGCGVALFGETVFTLVPEGRIHDALRVLSKYTGGIIIRARIDERGARVL